MSCNCKTTSSSCEPCAFCSPPGVTCLTTCKPIDPCDGERVDLCCVLYSGEDHECSEITHGEPICDILFQILAILFPPEVCCFLEGTLEVIPSPNPTTSTTTTIPPCLCYQVIPQLGSCHVYYVSCDGVPMATMVSDGEISVTPPVYAFVCAQEDSINIVPFVDGDTANVTGGISSCVLNTECVPCTCITFILPKGNLGGAVYWVDCAGISQEAVIDDITDFLQVCGSYPATGSPGIIIVNAGANCVPI